MSVAYFILIYGRNETQKTHRTPCAATSCRASDEAGCGSPRAHESGGRQGTRAHGSAPRKTGGTCSCSGQKRAPQRGAAKRTAPLFHWRGKAERSDHESETNTRLFTPRGVGERQAVPAVFPVPWVCAYRHGCAGGNGCCVSVFDRGARARRRRARAGGRDAHGHGAGAGEAGSKSASAIARAGILDPRLAGQRAQEAWFEESAQSSSIQQTIRSHSYAICL